MVDMVVRCVGGSFLVIAQARAHNLLNNMRNKTYLIPEIFEYLNTCFRYKENTK
jgi:hypothetical protein